MTWRSMKTAPSSDECGEPKEAVLVLTDDNEVTLAYRGKNGRGDRGWFDAVGNPWQIFPKRWMPKPKPLAGAQETT